MTRLASLIALVFVLLASPVLACEYGTSGAPIVGLGPVNGQTATLTAGTVFTPTLPTTYADGSTFSGTVYQMEISVTSGAINFWDNGLTPTSGTSLGGHPVGNCTGCSIYLEVCGASAVRNFKAIPQSGSPTLSITFYGARS